MIDKILNMSQYWAYTKGKFLTVQHFLAPGFAKNDFLLPDTQKSEPSGNMCS